MRGRWRAWRNLGALAVAAAALAGCTGVLGDRLNPTAATILSRDRFDATPPPRTVRPLYCYQTLARTDCHRAPVPGESSRIAGYYGPPPEGVGY